MSQTSDSTENKNQSNASTTLPARGLGNFLRSERESRHITIEQVASATKISIKLLHALEEDNFEELPAKPFVRGFVTSYSRFLGLDSHEILSKYDAFLDNKAEKKAKKQNKAPHIFVETDVQKDKSKTILGAILLGFLAIAIVVFIVVKPSLKHHRKSIVEKKHVSNSDLYTVVAPGTKLPDTNVADSNSPETDTGDVEATPDLKIPVEAEKPTSAKTQAQTKPEVAKPEVKAEAAKSVEKSEDHLTQSSAQNPAATQKQAATQTVKKTENKPSAEQTKTKPEPVANKQEPKNTKPESTQASSQQTLSANGIPPVNSKWPNVPYSEVKFLLVVRALEDSWIRYQADDFSLRQYTLKKGQKIFIRGRKNLRFRAYNDNGVEISYDNITFKPFQSGQTMILPPAAADQYREKPFIGVDD